MSVAINILKRLSTYADAGSIIGSLSYGSPRCVHENSDIDLFCIVPSFSANFFSSISAALFGTARENNCHMRKALQNFFTSYQPDLYCFKARLHGEKVSFRFAGRTYIHRLSAAVRGDANETVFLPRTRYRYYSGHQWYKQMTNGKQEFTPPARLPALRECWRRYSYSAIRCHTYTYRSIDGEMIKYYIPLYSLDQRPVDPAKTPSQPLFYYAHVPIFLIRQDKKFIASHCDVILSYPKIIFERSSVLSNTCADLWKTAIHGLYESAPRPAEMISLLARNNIFPRSHKEKIIRITKLL